MSSLAAGIAILGAGIFAKEAHLPALATLGAKAPAIRAVYSRSEKSAQDLASLAATILKLSSVPAVYHDGDPSAGLDVLLARSDIMAVLIILPITLQPSIVLKALAAGKHVLSEKPVAPDTTQGLELISKYLSEYKPKGLVWRVAENYEAEPGFRAAGAAIRAGRIGKVVFFNTRVVNYIDKDSIWYQTPWRTIPDYQGGFLLDGGVHTIALLRTILPRAITHLSGFASLNKDYLAPHDTIHAIAKAGPDFHGTAELTWASPIKSRAVPDHTTVTGTEGWLSLTTLLPAEPKGPLIRITIRTIAKGVSEPQEAEEIIEEPMRGVECELASFFAAIRGQDDGLGLGDPMGALRDVAFIQAALTSKGNIVDLDSLASSMH